MSEEISELKNIIEGALFIAGEPLTIDKILTLFPENSQPDREDIRAALKVLQDEYAERGVELKQIDKGYRFQSREKYSDWLGRLYQEKPPRYSRAVLETLAIIAYRQPVTRGDIEEIRGVSVSSDIIRQLLEREWIRQVGQRDVPGKPALYGTTRAFLEYFSLKGLNELPTLAELRDLDEISKELNLPLNLGEDAVGETDEADPESTEEETGVKGNDDTGTALTDESENPAQEAAALSAAPQHQSS